MRWKKREEPKRLRGGWRGEARRGGGTGRRGALPLSTPSHPNSFRLSCSHTPTNNPGRRKGTRSIKRSPFLICRARARTQPTMPLYELLALGVPRLPREEVARIIQRLGRAVYDRGGVVTDVKSYGEQPLAYKIRGTSGKYDQVRC